MTDTVMKIFKAFTLPNVKCSQTISMCEYRLRTRRAVVFLLPGGIKR